MWNTRRSAGVLGDLPQVATPDPVRVPRRGIPGSAPVRQVRPGRSPGPDPHRYWQPGCGVGHGGGASGAAAHDGVAASWTTAGQ